MAVTTGTLTNKISSTISSPTVHYAASYTATREHEYDKSVSVNLTFSAWLNSSSSKLGTGIKLTVFARINGGEWRSVVIKNTSALWSGTAKHSVSLKLSVSNTADKVRVDFYISRYGSNLSGTAGVLGSASNPKSYMVYLPSYSESGSGGGSGVTEPTQPTDEAYIYVNVGGIWKKAVIYVNVSGVWKRASPYVKVGGVWKSI